MSHFGFAANRLMISIAAVPFSSRMVTLGISRVEFDHVEASLGRLPRRTELSVFAGMWSEHCAYKSTRHLLKHLPRLA